MQLLRSLWDMFVQYIHSVQSEFVQLLSHHNRFFPSVCTLGGFLFMEQVLYGVDFMISRLLAAHISVIIWDIYIDFDIVNFGFIENFTGCYLVIDHFFYITFITLKFSASHQMNAINELNGMVLLLQ